MSAAVEINDLVKVFQAQFGGKPLRAVDQVSITIQPGEVYGLIGPNGSGKSTTMKALLGLVAPTSGRCSIFGADSLAVDSRRQVGFLPENPYFYKHLSGAETLRFFGKLCGLRGKALDSRVEELLDLVDLQGARDRRLGGYSKGMLQRIGLAQALVQEPRLVILDEPTAGVDPIGSRQIRDLILALKERGITVFLCSHLLEQVQEVCDRVGIIFRGRMVREGRLDDMLAIEDQTEIVLRNAPAELVDRIRGLVEQSAGASFVRSGKPRTTLERLFLEETTDRHEPVSAPTVRPLNPRRITVLAVNTFTQLVRMKVFYFLAIFAVIVIAANFLTLPVHLTPESTGVELLYSIKSWCTGTMGLFSLVMAIVATALLIPKDVEDRTLYTILAKPVPRLDYLLGKLLGVIALIFVSLLVMDLLMTAVLALRTEHVVEQQMAAADRFGYSPDMKAALEVETRALGPSWNLQAAVLAIFLRAVVMACVALLLSTFSTSTLFTAIVGFLVLFVGFFQADAREHYFSGTGALGRLGALVLSVFLPDLQTYNIVDALIEGKALELGQLGMVVGVTAFYFLVYCFASWIIFAKKEI